MTSDQLARIQGQTAFDNTGQKVGDIQRVFLDRDTNEPTWITVRAGRLAGQEAVVPLAGSRLGPSGLSLAVRKDAINNAPVIDMGSELDMEIVSKLNRYYDRSMTGTQPAPRPDVGTTEPQRRDEAGPVELTSFEEQVSVGTEAVENGTVRMRKVVVTEPVETTVALRHEEVRVERVPVDKGQATPGHRFAEEAAEVTLHEERPVITKETVPVETVRLAAETRMDQQRVTEQVRRERIEIDDQHAGEARRPDPRR